MEQQNYGTVEDLLSQIACIRDDQTTFELWVPQMLSLHDQPVALNVAMAIVGVALLKKEMLPDGFIQGDGGRYYKYRLER
jgi:hypothetical protein